ncbi:MarR family transcriptional regulator [filamentous cyanobacterium LEGE 11480]|uniref:MarR family transcriptional regulator n=1 Tax=Romeriopsis navalis LEGE 11480 TaxID=2777977 RepID=A0A928Z445_9CYAN|nr:helix-turn-helix domain-containing protein [Romeriopsis navalis]MBE9031369.1 MarR family transcriptional regulator [Romeriopsis navalis LEGE 11480]
MENLIARLNERLHKIALFRWIWPSSDQAEQSAPAVVLEDLPSAIRHCLLTTIQQLPTHPDIRAYIRSEVLDQLSQWQGKSENGCNSLVFLGRPTLEINHLVPDSLADWLGQQIYATPETIHILDWQVRPPSIDILLSQLKQSLQVALNGDRSTVKIVVIPNLNWCFLRSAEGLDGIEYLQQQIQDNPQIFWIIGAGQVAWEYLNSVLHIEAYCPLQRIIPALSGEQLQLWLKPMVRENQLQFPVQSISDKLNQVRQPDDAQDQSTSLETAFFERLADISAGIGLITTQIFLRSIYQDSEADLQPSESHQLMLTWPATPSFPDIDRDDSYVLYSLLMHGDLSLPQLAESLGDPIEQVNAAIQNLRRLGLIEQQGSILQVNPIYYLPLCDRLSRENFVIPQK